MTVSLNVEIKLSQHLRAEGLPDIRCARDTEDFGIVDPLQQGADDVGRHHALEEVRIEMLAA